MEKQNYDLFGNPIIENTLLRDKFIEPPFSVLNTMNDKWQGRKRKWKSLGIKSEVSREEYAGMTKGSQKHNALWDAKVIRECYLKAIQ